MTDKIRKHIKLSKLIRKTIFYMFVTNLVLVILLPVFFLFSLSFLSTREAYNYPLPILPSFKTEYSLTYGEKGYLLSVFDRFEKEYQTVLDSSEPEKISVYMRRQISTPFDIEKVEEKIDELVSGPDDTIYFSVYKNPLQNYDTFFKVTRDAVPALLRSFQIAGVTILIALSVGGMAGYAFARYIFV